MTLHALAAHGCRTVIAAQSRDAARSRDDRDIDFEIERLLDAFLADELTTPELSHRRQVQVAWVLLRHADFQCALQVFATSMQRRSARAGVEFNVTITTALMNIVAEALAESGHDVSWRAFERDNPQLVDSSRPQPWYSAGLSDRVARAQFVSPSAQQSARGLSALAPLATTFLPSGTIAA
jgi:hypothetical protein